MVKLLHTVMQDQLYGFAKRTMNFDEVLKEYSIVGKPQDSRPVFFTKRHKENFVLKIFDINEPQYARLCLSEVTAYVEFQKEGLTKIFPCLQEIISVREHLCEQLKKWHGRFRSNLSDNFIVLIIERFDGPKIGSELLKDPKFTAVQRFSICAQILFGLGESFYKTRFCHSDIGYCLNNVLVKFGQNEALGFQSYSKQNKHKEGAAKKGYNISTNGALLCIIDFELSTIKSSSLNQMISSTKDYPEKNSEEEMNLEIFQIIYDTISPILGKGIEFSNDKLERELKVLRDTKLKKMREAIKAKKSVFEFIREESAAWIRKINYQ